MYQLGLMNADECSKQSLVMFKHEDYWVLKGATQ